MSFASQRGGTCTVAAFDEVAFQGRFKWLITLFEASLWAGMVSGRFSFGFHVGSWIELTRKNLKETATEGSEGGRTRLYSAQE